MTHKVQPIARNPTLVIWKPTPSSWVCLNSDGTAKEDLGAVYGGNFHDNYGVWLGGFHNGIGNCNNFAAELWGVLLGWDLAWKHGFRKVIIQIENKTVVDSLSGASWSFKHGSILINHICRLLPLFQEMQFQHIFPEANLCADYLAKLSLSNVFEVS